MKTKKFKLNFSVPTIILTLILVLVAGASLFYLNRSDEDFLAAIADPYTCDPSSCYGSNGCSLHTCHSAGCSGDIGSCDNGHNYCHCSGDSCVNAWRCEGNLSCGDAASGACTDPNNCSTCTVRCESCGNSAKDCHFSSPSITTSPPPPPTDEPPDTVYIEGNRYCMNGDPCDPDSGCYCPGPSIVIQVDTDTLEEVKDGTNVDGVAMSYEDPYSFHISQGGYNLKSSKPGGADIVKANSCESCADDPDPSPQLSPVEWHSSEGRYYQTIATTGEDIDVNWFYDLRAYVLGRVKDNTTESEYWRSGDCSSCSGSCNTAASMSIECTDGTTTEDLSWECNDGGAYHTSTDLAFERGSTVSCTASNPPSGHQFGKWTISNLHPSLSITGTCDPQSNTCDASFTVDQGTTGAGNNNLDFLLVTPTPYIEVNVENDKGDPVTVDVYAIECVYGSCLSKFETRGSHVTFSKSLLSGDSVGGQIKLEQGDSKYMVSRVEADPDDSFEIRTNETASLNVEEKTAQEKDSIINRLIASIVGIFKPESDAAMDDPDSDYMVWDDAASWNTGGRTMTAVVVTPAVGGNFYEGSASQGGGRDIICQVDPPPASSVSLSDVVVEANHNDGIDTKSVSVSSDSYSIPVDNDCSDCYDVELRLPTPAASATSAYVCACSVEDNFTCRYIDQASPKDDINFFVQEFDLSAEPWWQVYGGNIYAEQNIQSLIPTPLCSGDCQPALSVSDIDNTTNSAGFPIVNTGSITTEEGGSTGYIHQSGDRDNAYLGHATGITIPERGFQYYFNKLEQEIDLDDGEWGTNGQKPNYTEADGSAEIYYHNGNLTIGDSNSWSVASDEKIIVMIDGNLTLDDQLGTDQIIDVAQGGVVAFIVSGDINITPDVGYDMPDVVDVDLVVENNPALTAANIEGIFLADGELNINSYGSSSDKKFIGAGTFVGWTAVNLNRDFAEDNTVLGVYNHMNPTSSFIFRPDFVVNSPFELQEAQIEWREVEPERPTAVPTPE
jgi:hypothetical protein